ncbi:MAG TPA: hypothetical protein VGT61_12120 [Thermomicrobiales bacterium]|jgi:hypothetical protein|nr:hypothetical protein [Thermomicrobiales bacterium]
MARPETDEDDERLMARERTRQAIARGDYAGLIAPGLQKVLAAAAVAGDGGQGDAIAALRYAMYRLLAEEEDPRQLAGNLTKVVNSLRLAVRARQPGADAASAFQLALADQLMTMGLGAVDGHAPIGSEVIDGGPPGDPDEADDPDEAEERDDGGSAR